jgi:hypothetical protein
VRRGTRDVLELVTTAHHSDAQQPGRADAHDGDKDQTGIPCVPFSIAVGTHLASWGHRGSGRLWKQVHLQRCQGEGGAKDQERRRTGIRHDHGVQSTVLAPDLDIWQVHGLDR